MREKEVPPRYLSVRQAAAYTGSSEKSIRYRVETRQLPFCRIGGSIRFDKDELDRFIARNAVEPLGAADRRR